MLDNGGDRGKGFKKKARVTAFVLSGRYVLLA